MKPLILIALSTQWQPLHWVCTLWGCPELWLGLAQNSQCRSMWKHIVFVQFVQSLVALSVIFFRSLFNLSMVFSSRLPAAVKSCWLCRAQGSGAYFLRSLAFNFQEWTANVQSPVSRTQAKWSRILCHKVMDCLWVSEIWRLKAVHMQISIHGHLGEQKPAARSS